MEDPNENATIEKFIDTFNLHSDKCRLCLKETNEVWQLFQINDELPRKIMACAHVQIDEGDGLPTIICSTCRHLLDVSYNFKCQVEKSDAKLRHSIQLKTTPMIGYGATTVGINNSLTQSVNRVITEAIADEMKIRQSNFTVDDGIKSHVELAELTSANSAIEVDERVISGNQDCVMMIDRLNNSNQDNGYDGTILFNVDIVQRNRVDVKHESNVDEIVLNHRGNEEHEEKPGEKDRVMNPINADKNKRIILDISRGVAPMNNVLVEKLEQFEVIKVENCISTCNESRLSDNNENRVYCDDGNEDCDDDEDEDDDEEEECDDDDDNSEMFIGSEPRLEVKTTEEDFDSDEEKPLSSRTSKLRCKVCMKAFTSRLALQQHTAIHVINKTKLRYVCYMCDKQFATIDKLKNHVLTAHDSLKDDKTNEDELNCNNVDIGEESHLKIDDKIPLIAELLRKEDKKTLKFSCKYCSKKFTYEKPFLTHAKRHPEYEHVQKDDSIMIGDKLKSHNTEIEQGYELENDDMPLEGLQCTKCGKLFATKRNLTRHLSTHTGLRYNCATCKKEFSRLDKLKEHEQIKHKNEFFEQLDDDDDDDSDNETKINCTEASKKDKHKRPHKCPLCPKAFAQAQSLTNHMERHKRVKDTQKRFLCEVCSKCFAQSGSLVAHMRTHTGVKPYVCNVCNRAFTKSTYLQLHLRTHSGEKPYICQYCSRAFARANTLARHITMHTGEAKYHCQICMKSFRRLTSLNEHTYTHTGQRPYACKICSKRYNNAGSLYAHTKKCKVQQSTNSNDNPSFNNMNIDASNPDSSGATSTIMIHSDKKLPNTPNVVLNVTNAENVGNIISSQSATSSPPSFIIANNVHNQKSPMTTNVIQQYTVEEPNIYTVNTKHYKNPYYTVYPGI